MLEQLDFEVETVDSAEAALNRLSKSLPHVVFMDHLLPGMQGLEAVRKLRSRPDTVETRIVMYTSQDGDLFATRRHWRKSWAALTCWPPDQARPTSTAK
jgi:CheY-like chemotaxis protein